MTQRAKEGCVSMVAVKERGQEAVRPPVEAELQQLPARAVGEPARLAR